MSTLSSAQFLVALDLDDAEGAEARIRLAAPLTREQLESALPAQISESVETDNDPRNGALRARRVRRLDALILEEEAGGARARGCRASVAGAAAAAGNRCAAVGRKQLEAARAA